MNINYKILFILTIGVLAAASLVTAFTLLNPTPPRMVVMSTGSEGSAYAEYAEYYREWLASNGIELELRSSGGAQENLERLQDPDGDVSVAFITLGSPDTENATSLQSLGAMFFEPLWVFTKDADLANGNLESIRDKRISIGPQGSRTNAATRGLFELGGIDTSELEFVPLESVDAARQLKAGTVDAAFMVANAATPVIRDLLATQDMFLINFERADAFTALYPQLKKLIVPAGVGDLARDLPPEDAKLLAFTAILGIRDDLHPAIQSLFLEAAAEIHAIPDLFHADGRFPSTTVYRIPLSSTASRYYTSGQTLLQRFLPFWLEVLVMQVLVAALPLIGIVYPALKLMPSAFKWAMRHRIFNLYGELRRLEARLARSAADQEKVDFVGELDDLERRVRNLKVPLTYSNLVFALRSHINVVRTRFRSLP